MRGGRRTPARFVTALAALGALVAPVRAASVPTADGPTRFPLIAILCYHDLSDDPGTPLQTVPAEFLRAQLRACRAQGWSFLSLEQLLAARENPERLPPRVMVLTFDDGYRSFADQALPVLAQEHVPATLAVITSFVGEAHPELPALLSWPELRRLDERADVDVVSHSHALHQYELSNPQRDTAPSPTARRWLPEAGRYEDREQYRSRIGADLAESQRVLDGRLGHPVHTLVWPYGQRNEMALAQARLAGFTTTLSLDARPVTAADLRDGCLPRVMVTRRMQFADSSLAWLTGQRRPVQAAEIELDELWDPDDRLFRERLDLAVTRARALGATDVILPVCSDPHQDGQLLRAYAMNHQLPVLADVWSMAAAKFSVAGLHVWARTPTMDLTWAWERHPEWRIPACGRSRVTDRWRTRLSPDLPPVHGAAVDFVTDLAVYLPIDGVLFDDDATMPACERLAGSGANDAAAKSVAIRGLIEDCKRAVHAWRPECRFARCVPGSVVARIGVERESAVDLDECWSRDELTVVSAGEGARDGEPRTIEQLARRAVRRWRAGGGAGDVPLLLMLAARDPGTHRGVNAGRQQAMAEAARRGGLVHLGTRPVAAEGELPLGLLDPRVPTPAVRTADRR